MDQSGLSCQLKEIVQGMMIKKNVHYVRTVSLKRILLAKVNFINIMNKGMKNLRANVDFFMEEHRGEEGGNNST